MMMDCYIKVKEDVDVTSSGGLGGLAAGAVLCQQQLLPVLPHHLGMPAHTAQD